MQLSQFVTDYDESLLGDTYIDPLGVLVIWSAFGGHVFRNRVNSISNDVRNYTLNLMNHRIIRDLIDDDSVVVSRALENAIGDKHSLSFRQACLIYLENLFLYSLISAESRAGVETGGILGGSKGRKVFEESKGSPKLMLSHTKDAHLLVRQLSLGVGGRYKTPFMEIGFFDTHYHYHLPEADGLWARADQLFQSSGRLRAVYDTVRAHLASLINVGTTTASSPPSYSFADVPLSLKKAYQDAYASPGRVGAETRAFWLELTGLDHGAAGALLHELDKHATDADEVPLEDEQVFRLAEKRCNKLGDDGAASMIQHILTLEPLLAEVDLLFTLSLHRRNQRMAEVETLWREMGRGETTLPKLAGRIREFSSLIGAIKGTARARLEQLLQVASLETLEEQLRALLEYHAGVMRSRGQFPWVAAKSADLIQVEARTQPLPDKDKRAPGHWVNHYYLPQFRNLVDGFRGVPA